MAQIEITGNFEGYLWDSDKQAPEVYCGEKLLSSYIFDNEINPFIIEGQLFDALTGLSVSIKYVDGEYKINEYYVNISHEGKAFFVLKKDDNDKYIKCEVKCEVNELHYKGNSNLEGNNLLFYELWEEDCDPACCNMKVLKATKVCFAGFEK